MLKKAISLALLILAIYWSFSALMPGKISSLNAEENTFSTERALVHLAAISQKPHYVGSKEHKNVRDYIVKQLNELGLETHTQKGYSISKWGNIAQPINILARIKGRENGKALMLLSHYDSSPHSSLGASDAGSGVVTILEGIRAYLSEGNTPKNDIIVCITDSEELGLNGADLFVNQHEWAGGVGLVLNFEARGSGGPSYMLIETNGGNSNLMKGFVEANPKYPVANSLAYSIYKMLPNDTDLTVFRRDGDIEGFNFAFIDDHYDYHTALDSYERLDRNTLEHQGSYLMPMLNYFAEANLNNLKSDDDDIYFNIPIFKTVTYPFSWILPMLIIAILLFLGLIVYGKRKKVLHLREIAKGFGAFTAALLVSYALTQVLWWYVIKNIYPEYSEILHGFTYNGYTYIWSFAFLTIGICFYIYHKVYKVKNRSSLLIAPIFFWILICGVVAFQLKGASFFIIPVFFALLSLFLMIKYGKGELKLLLITLLCFPVLLIMSPFIKMFPVGLGLKVLYVSAIFIVLIFGLLIPVFGTFKHKNRWSYVCFFLSFITFLSAHFNSGFTKDNPKPNSLIYTLNAENHKATWATYDETLDDWTRNFLGEDPDNASNNNTLGSKYATGFTYIKSAPAKALLYPKVEVVHDTVIGNYRHFDIYVTPQRDVNRMEIFSDTTNLFKTFKINGISAYKKETDTLVFNNRWRNRLFSYYVSENEPLKMEISVPKNQKTTLQLYEASFDLLKNSQFTVPKRAENMIPKPFVLNDAVVITKEIVVE